MLIRSHDFALGLAALPDTAELATLRLYLARKLTALRHMEAIALQAEILGVSPTYIRRHARAILQHVRTSPELEAALRVLLD